MIQHDECEMLLAPCLILVKLVIEEQGRAESSFIVRKQKPPSRP